jgi:small subunit ribosomal protein S16
VAVKIRLKRFGRKNRPFWRINAVDSRSPRDGKVLEELGYYDPLERDNAKAVVVRKERVEYWLKVGAQPSPTVDRLLQRATDAAALPPPQRKPRTPVVFAPSLHHELPAAPAPARKAAAPAAPAEPAAAPEPVAAQEPAPAPEAPTTQEPAPAAS